MVDLKEFWNLQNLQYVRAVAKCRVLNLEQPEFTNKTNELMISWYENFILEAKKAYYVSEEPVMDDQSYDKCEDLLRLLKPDSLALCKVGYEMENLK